MTVAFGVPAKITATVPPEHIVVSPVIEIVGGGSTVIVTAPVAGAVQPGAPVVVTLTKV